MSMWGNKSQRLLMAVSVFALAASGVAMKGDVQNLPSVEAFNGLSKQEVQLMDYYKTEQGFKLVLSHGHFKQISEGMTYQTYFENNLGVLIDQVPVDTTELVSLYGFDYQVEFNFVIKEDGFNIHTYAVKGSEKAEIELDTATGFIVHIPQNLFLQGEQIQLMTNGKRADQLNDDGIIYAVIYNSGTYRMETTDGQSLADSEQGNGLYAVVQSKETQSQPTVAVAGAQSETESEVSLPSVQDTATREEVEVDSVEVVEAISSNPTTMFGLNTSTAKPVTPPKEAFAESVASLATSVSTADISTVTETAETSPFEDMASVEDAEKIASLLQQGVWDMEGDNLFQPTLEVTRAQFATMLSRALSLDAVTYGENPYSDITDKSLARAVANLYNKGYMLGTTDKTFSPDGGLTKQQVAVIIHRILEDYNLTEGVDLLGDSFEDINSVAYYAKQSVVSLKTLNLMSGTDSVFNPHKLVTRNQTASLLYDTMELLSIPS